MVFCLVDHDWHNNQADFCEAGQVPCCADGFPHHDFKNNNAPATLELLNCEATGHPKSRDQDIAAASTEFVRQGTLVLRLSGKETGLNLLVALDSNKVVIEAPLLAHLGLDSVHISLVRREGRRLAVAEIFRVGFKGVGDTKMAADSLLEAALQDAFDKASVGIKLHGASIQWVALEADDNSLRMFIIAAIVFGVAISTIGIFVGLWCRSRRGPSATKAASTPPDGKNPSPEKVDDLEVASTATPPSDENDSEAGQSAATKLGTHDIAASEGAI